MLPQARLILERLHADGTVEFHLIVLMFLHVLGEIAARGESLATDVACVGLLARVNALVSNQVAYLREGTATFFTLIRLVFLMNATYVLLKRAVLGEAGIALRALVWSLTRMRPHMLHQCLLAVKTAITCLDLALKLKLALLIVHLVSVHTFNKIII